MDARITILVIDDVQEQREVVTNMLAKLGYSLSTVLLLHLILSASSLDGSTQYLCGSCVLEQMIETASFS